ncbi:DUF3224 domain-containing protein [Reinekea sp.]|uniref:DUF3224 domain-containing protein n=1 Tax=Reinekea sp. TaxID=1970455 RepID=UPI00398A3191
MTNQLNCTFSVVDWNEQIIEEKEGYKTSQAHVTYLYQGDIVGESKAEFTLLYQPDETAVFTALEKIEGAFNGKPGTLILSHSGIHDNAARGRCVIERGYGAMKGKAGLGQYIADASSVSLSLELID